MQRPRFSKDKQPVRCWKPPVSPTPQRLKPTTTVSAAFWMLRLPKGPLPTLKRPMFSRGHVCSPRSRSWLFELEARGRERKKASVRKGCVGFARRVRTLFFVQSLCSLCLCGYQILGKTSPQRHREHRGCTEKSAREYFSRKASCVLARVIADDELFTSSFIRHSRLVLPGMAHLSGAGCGAYRCHPMAAVAISDWACLSNCGVPKPDSTFRVRTVARLLWLMRIETMGSDTKTNTRVRVGRWLSGGIVVAAVLLGLVVLHRTNHYPRTDDAEVLANFIGIAPQVEGRIIRL